MPRPNCADSRGHGKSMRNATTNSKQPADVSMLFGRQSFHMNVRGNRSTQKCNSNNQHRQSEQAHNYRSYGHASRIFWWFWKLVPNLVTVSDNKLHGLKQTQLEWRFRSQVQPHTAPPTRSPAGPVTALWPAPELPALLSSPTAMSGE